MKIAISCSMKFRDVAKSVVQELKSLGFETLFPNLEVSSENKDVAKDIEEKKKLALDHYKAIEQADALYLILPNGYIGKSGVLDIGYAFALQKPIYFSEKTNDFTLDFYPKKIIPLTNLTDFKKEPNTPDNRTV